MEQPTQFLHEGPDGDAQNLSTGSSRAIYVLPGRSANGSPITIAVDCLSGGGNVPRNATNYRAMHKNIATNLDSELESIAAVAENVLNRLKALQPGGVEIEFGVELGGEIGVPLVTKGEAKANFKVTLKWKDSALEP